MKRVARRERSLSQEVEEWIALTSGYFSLTELCFSLQFLTQKEKNNAYQIMHRLSEKGVIEKHPNKNGLYRRIEQELEEIDFLDASTEIVDIVLPFGIHEKAEIMPGNIILIAGEVNSGKTAFCLNIIRENMRSFEIHYFNSEMGRGELKKRLVKFHDIVLADWKFKAYERSDNFADVIVPGKGRINIIDFLEIHKDFYEVGARIAEIHKKLKGAIAIIALQKNKGLDVGLGGYRSLEKPRLALAMSPGQLKIVKAKNWKTDENPNGLVTGFKIVQGCKLYQDGFWHREQ